MSEDFDAFREAALTLAFERNGAVVVNADGTIDRQMPRIISPDGDSIECRQAFEFADRMRTNHLSTVAASAHEKVLATVTLSEEDGRMTVFYDGNYEDKNREELGERWRPAE